MARLPKAVLVVLGAVVFSTVAIQASDVMRNIEGNLAGLAIEREGVCGQGQTHVHVASGPLCVDTYEAAPGEKCPHKVPTNELETQANLNEFECTAISEADTIPWRYVSMQQAQQLCARSGKRLPNNDEWYALVSATGDQTECNTNSNGPKIAGATACTTQSGIYDLVGNVWEWIDAEVVNGSYNGRPVPVSGYVQLVDADGVVLETGDSANAEYGSDYASTNNDGVYGMVRGGFYGSGEDAGLYAQNMAVSFDIKAPGVGFRCVRSAQ